METTEQAVWDQRYSGPDLVWGAGPNRFVTEEAAALPAGRAVDLGTGEGRNAIWLAERGWQVTAVDFSAAGLAIAGRGHHRHPGQAGGCRAGAGLVRCLAASWRERGGPPGSEDRRHGDGGRLLTSFSAYAAGSSSSQRSCSPSASTCLSPWAPRYWSSRSTAPPRSPPASAATSSWTGRCSACSPPPRWPQPRRVPGRCLPAHRRFYHPAHRRSRLLAHQQPGRAGVTASYPRRGAHPDGRVPPEDLRLYAQPRPWRWDGASFRGRRADGHPGAAIAIRLCRPVRSSHV